MAVVGPIQQGEINVESNEQAPWGRVDETGIVYVREASGERIVGEYPDGTAEEALAYFERKFTELAGQVTLLEQRAKRGAPAHDIAKTVTTLTKLARSTGSEIFSLGRKCAITTGAFSGSTSV